MARTAVRDTLPWPCRVVLSPTARALSRARGHGAAPEGPSCRRGAASTPVPPQSLGKGQEGEAGL